MVQYGGSGVAKREEGGKSSDVTLHEGKFMDEVTHRKVLRLIPIMSIYEKLIYKCEIRAYTNQADRRLCFKIPTGWRQTRWLHTKRSTGVEPVVSENKYRAESGTTRLQVQRPRWFSKKKQNSVLTTFNLFSFFILCFQPECPLCRESVQLSRLVFLHHYEPTWRPHVTCSNVYRQTHP